jgi:hypothetical protein
VESESSIDSMGTAYQLGLIFETCQVISSVRSVAWRVLSLSYLSKWYGRSPTLTIVYPVMFTFCYTPNARQWVRAIFGGMAGLDGTIVPIHIVYPVMFTFC